MQKFSIFRMTLALVLVAFLGLIETQAQISQTGNSVYLDDTDAYFGVGTQNPEHPLHIVTPMGGNWQAKFDNNTKVYLAKGNGFGIFVRTYSSLSSRYAMHLQSNAGILFRVNNDGKVGIGTTTLPAMTTAEGSMYRLYVNGGGLFKEVTIETDWADYVFDKDYKLTSLEEVEEHIEENGHLHKTPSAEELEERGGVELGEATVAQQEKIEEVFLHLIELNKKIKKLEEENQELREKVEELEK